MRAVSPVRFMVGLVAVPVLALSGACSSGGGSGTATPSAAASTVTAVAATPLPTAQVSGSTYTFREKGYAIDAPAGWQAQPNSVFDKVNSVFPSDAFFAPDVVGNAQANITITCQKPRNDQATLEQYRDARQALLRQIANVDVAPREVTVAGVPAFAFDYTEKISTQNISLDKTEVTLLTARCRWLITLSVPGGERAKYATLFDQALASLKFLG